MEHVENPKSKQKDRKMEGIRIVKTIRSRNLTLQLGAQTFSFLDSRN